MPTGVMLYDSLLSCKRRSNCGALILLLGASEGDAGMKGSSDPRLRLRPVHLGTVTLMSTLPVLTPLDASFFARGSSGLSETPATGSDSILVLPPIFANLSPTRCSSTLTGSAYCSRDAPNVIISFTYVLELRFTTKRFEATIEVLDNAWMLNTYDPLLRHAVNRSGDVGRNAATLHNPSLCHLAARRLLTYNVLRARLLFCEQPGI